MRDMRGDALPAITITPNPALSDEPVRVRLLGCAPGQRMTLRAEVADDAGQRWRSLADFAANGAGAVDVATGAPLAGSYSDGGAPVGQAHANADSWGHALEWLGARTA
jgi:hypothetical protein